MKKKINLFIVVLILFAIFLPIKVNAKVQEVKIVYFGTKTCLDCAKTIKYLNKMTEKLEKENIPFSYYFYDILEGENNELLRSYDKAYGVPEKNNGVWDKVFIGDKYFIGTEEIEEKLNEKILFYHKNINEYKPIEVEVKSKDYILDKSSNLIRSFAPLTVFTAGFIDGFNPCAIAMLLFFISFIVMTERKKSEILLTGFAYIMGTFIAYFGIGVGLLRFAIVFQNAKSIMIGVYSITILMALYLMIMNIRDFIRVKSGNYKDVKTQLPQNLKHIIHKFIRKNNVSKAIYLSAFVSGLVISFLEFFCTGQIYLPTISYVLSSGTSMGIGLTYLFLYNLAFVIPLIVICVSIYKGKEVIDISQVLLSKLHMIKLLGAVFFLLISVVMIIQLLKIF